MRGDVMVRDEVRVIAPADAAHLRTLRLVAADAGSRAGLDASEVDDLRIAVGELCQALMRVTDEHLSVLVQVDGAKVTISARTEHRHGATAPSLGTIPALMVDAVSDSFRLVQAGSESSFVVVKRAGALTDG